MAIGGASLADGQLPATKGTLYTAASVTYIRSFVLHSTGDGQTVIIYLKRASGSSRVIGYGTMDNHYTIELIDEAPLEMSAGDILEGVSTNASTVDYTITGGVTA